MTYILLLGIVYKGKDIYMTRNMNYWLYCLSVSIKHQQQFCREEGIPHTSSSAITISKTWRVQSTKHMEDPISEYRKDTKPIYVRIGRYREN